MTTATDTPERLFHTLAKPAGARCNLACAYCFYLDREALYPGSRFRMSDEVLDLYLRQVVEIFRDVPVVPLAWQGGEPTLMGLEFYQQATAKARALLREGQRLQQSLQTNGLLLDQAWCQWLAQERVLVGLSIDGPADVHDRWRVDRRGRGSFAQVAAAARLLSAHGVDTNAMVSVHAANQERGLEVYRYLRDELGFRFFQLIPVVEWDGQAGAPLGAAGWRRADAPVSEHTVDPDAWGRFLCAVFDEWVRRDVGRVFVIRFEAALAAWTGGTPAPCVFRETCGEAVALEHTGDVYACDHFVSPAYRLGNIRERPLAELVASPAQRAFGLAKRDTLPARCRRCPVLFACRGECPKHRILRTEEGEPGLSWLCAGYEAFFAHIAEPMALLAGQVRAGRPAAAVMDLLRAREHGGVGRHDPCPCGSGQKYKRCHGDPVAQPGPRNRR